MVVNETSRGTSPREALYAVFADRTRSFGETVERALEIGVEFLDADIAALTRITDDTQHLSHVVGSHGGLEAGAYCPLENAYCRRTVEITEPLTVQNAESSEDVSTLAFETFELGCYIGAKVFVDDETYGTVCFGGADPRDRPFDHVEELFVELIAQLVSQAVERREHERKLAARNEQLAAEKDRFQDIAETAFDAIYRIDAAAQFTYVSSSAERIIGYAPDELTGEFFGDYIAESSLETALDAFSRVFDGEHIENLQLTFRAKREDVVLEINVRPVFEDGTVVEVQGVARDVTTRVEQERSLRVQNRAMEDSQLGIVIAEVDGEHGSLVFANTALETLTGYTQAELVEMTHETLLCKTVDDDVAADLRAHIDRQVPFDSDVLHYRKNGTPHWVQLSMSPVVDERGETTHFVQFYRDITEQERTQRLVDVLNRVLRHNLRNGMNVIQGYAETLMEIGDVTSQHVDAVRRISNTATSLTELTERAQELERYTRTDPRPTRIAPDAMLARIVANHRDSYPESRVDVTVSTTRDVCAGPEFERAVSELVTNALQHNPSPVDVSVTVTDADERLYIEVVDDGDGVSPLEVASIQSGRETALEHGSRLGLWVVNWIVTQYGGSFRIRADEAGGTVASILIQGIDADTPVEEVSQYPTPLSR